MGKIRDNFQFASGKIKQADSKNKLISFSLKYWDKLNKKFCVKKCGSKYFNKLLERFQSISELTTNQVRTSHADNLRFHLHEWHKTTEPTGYSSLPKHLKDTPPCQFQISSNEHGRVHGFFIGEIFFVVWLDPEHALYNGKK